MDHSVQMWIETHRYSDTGFEDVCHEGCAYAVLQAVQNPYMKFVYGIAHRVGPVGLPSSVVILP